MTYEEERELHKQTSQLLADAGCFTCNRINNEIIINVNEDQFNMLKILSKLGLFEIINWSMSDMTYYVTVKQKI